MSLFNSSISPSPLATLAQMSTSLEALAAKRKSPAFDVTYSAVNHSGVDHSDVDRAKSAAQQFESLMIAQMLHSVRESSGGLAGLEDGSGDESEVQNSPLMDLADQQFATLLAQQGGIGLSRLVVRGLANSQK